MWMPTELGFRASDDLIDAGGIPDVAECGEGLAPVGADRFRNGFRAGAIPVEDDDAGPLLGKQPGRGFSNAGPGSGYERGFPIQPAKRLVFHNLPRLERWTCWSIAVIMFIPHGLVKGKFEG